MSKRIAIVLGCLCLSAAGRAWAADLIVDDGNQSYTVTGGESYDRLFIGSNPTGSSSWSGNPALLNLLPSTGTSNNTVTVTGAGNLSISGTCYIATVGGYSDVGRPAGDYNRLIVENGGVVNIGGRFQQAQDYEFTPWTDPPAPDTRHNQTIVNTGGTLNVTLSMNVWAGDIIVNGGTINCNADGANPTRWFGGWSQSGQFPGTAGGSGKLFAYGTINCWQGYFGYHDFPRIGDGISSTPMVFNLTGGVNSLMGLYSWAGGVSHELHSNPYDSNSPLLGPNYNGVVAANGVLAGSATIWSTEDNNAYGWLIQSGGRVSPGKPDNSQKGEFHLGEGFLEWENGANLNIDLFGSDDFDKITGASGTALKINAGAKLNITAHYALEKGLEWDILTWNDRTGIFQLTGDTGDADVGFGMTYDDANGVGALFTAVYGDANLDGKVDISDLAIMATNWNGTGKLWATADFNGDNAVNISDLAIMATHWNYGVGGGGMTFDQAMSLNPVPEPASAAILLLGGLLLGRRRFHKARL